MEAKVGKLGSIQFASALLMGLASTFIGQVTVPNDGSMNDGIIVAFAFFAVLTVQNYLHIALWHLDLFQSLQINYLQIYQ